MAVPCAYCLAPRETLLSDCNITTSRVFICLAHTKWHFNPCKSFLWRQCEYYVVFCYFGSAHIWISSVICCDSSHNLLLYHSIPVHDLTIIAFPSSSIRSPKVNKQKESATYPWTLYKLFFLWFLHDIDTSFACILLFFIISLIQHPFFFLLIAGRRGVFDGTVENMHLHWKYRELVKIICKEHNIKDVEYAARTLEAESGGILVAVERVSKAHAIIIYRGKNYQRPSTLRPKSLLNKKDALKRSVEYQRYKVKLKPISLLWFTCGVIF